MLTNEKLDNFLTNVCYPHITKKPYERASNADTKLLISKL